MYWSSKLRLVPFSLILATICTTLPILLAPAPTLLAAETETNTLPESSAWIVLGDSSSKLDSALKSIGVNATHKLNIIDGVAVRLTPEELEQVSRLPNVKNIWRDQSVEMASTAAGSTTLSSGSHAKGSQTYTHYPAQTGAGILHAFGIDGDGVTVAIVDTGFWKVQGLKKNRDREKRVLAQYDAINDEVVSTWSKGITNDDNGHGTHVTSIIMDSSRAYGFYRGVAPGADLVSVKAFDASGTSNYSDVIRGIDWVVAHKDEYDIRIMNLSFGAAPQSFYWDDPLNRAVMAAWREDIVVVTSAGNGGPDPYTISVPGNNPYVITTGAMTDSYSPYNFSDDVLTSFSAAGPTASGWIKPDLVSYGGHLLAALPADSFIGQSFPEWAAPPRFYELSGTSQAAAVTSGIAALLLQLDPSLSADDVKCKLTTSALVALDEEGNDAYNPLQQGAGLVNAITAVLSDESGCGNIGLDVAADLDEDRHWGGPVRRDEDGSLFILVGGDAVFLWDGTYSPVDSVVFSDHNPWADTQHNPWADTISSIDHNPWADTDSGPVPNHNPWADTFTWLEHNPWADTNTWIEAYPEIFGINSSPTSGGPRDLPQDWSSHMIETDPVASQE